MKKILISFIGFFLGISSAYGATLSLDSAIKMSETLLANTAETIGNISWDAMNDALILQLHEKGLTIHKTRSEFKFDRNIRRDEAAKMLTLASAYLPQSPGFLKDKTCSFADLDKARSDLQTIIVESCEKGLFKGAHGLFKPDQPISNGQLMTVLGRMLFGIQDESQGHYASNYVALLEKNSYLSGLNISAETTWNQDAKRGMLAQLLAKVLNEQKK